MCNQNGESIDHLLLYCEVIIELWNMVCQMFGVMWVMPGRMKDCLGSWRGQRGNYAHLENGSSMCNVVFMERKECIEF